MFRYVSLCFVWDLLRRKKTRSLRRVFFRRNGGQGCGDWRELATDSYRSPMAGKIRGACDEYFSRQPDEARPAEREKNEELATSFFPSEANLPKYTRSLRRVFFGRRAGVEVAKAGTGGSLRPTVTAERMGATSRLQPQPEPDFAMIE